MKQLSIVSRRISIQSIKINLIYSRSKDTFSKCTNRDMKTSLLNAVVDFIPGREVGNILFIIKIGEIIFYHWPVFQIPVKKSMLVIY